MAINVSADAKFGKLAIVMNETLFDFAAPSVAQIEAQIAQIKGNIPFFVQFASAGSTPQQVQTFAEILAFEQLVAATLDFPQFAGLSSLQIARQSFENIQGAAPSDAAINALLAAYNGNVAILIANIIVQEAGKPAIDLAAGTFLAQAANGTAVFGVPLIVNNNAPTNIVDATDNDQTLSVVEKAAAGSVVGTVKSIDADLGDAGTFSLAAPSNVFAISATGEITVKAGATAPDASVGSVVLSVKVTDQGGASITRNITVTLDSDPALHNFSLTPVAAETILGTPGNDTFSSNAASLNAGDRIEGGGGNDTLRFASALGLIPVAGFTTVSVENLEITGEGPLGAAIDVTGMAGLTRVINSNSSGDVDVVGAKALVDLDLNEVSDGNTRVVYDAPVIAGTNDTQKIKLTDVNSLANNPTSSITVNGVETFDITTVGPQPSKLTALNSNALDKVIVRGNARLSVVAPIVNLSLFDASTNTGGVEVELGVDNNATVKGSTVDDIIEISGGAAAAGTTLTVDMGAGADKLTLNGPNRLGTVDVKMGAGVDTLDVTNAGDLRTGHTYDGGSEDDTFQATDAQIDQIQSLVAPNNPVIKAFETLEVTTAASGTWDMDEISQDFNKVVLTNGLGANLAINDIKNGLIIDVNANEPAHTDELNLTVAHKTDTAADVLNLIIHSTDTDGADEIKVLTINTTETLNLTVDSTDNDDSDVDIEQIVSADLKSIVLTGDAEFRVDTAAAISNLTNLTSFNATGYTGSVINLDSIKGSNAGITFDFRNASNSAEVNIRGQAGVDTINLGGGDDTDVFGQGGADFIDAGDGNDGAASAGSIDSDGTLNGINGGDGDDVVLGGKGNDVVFGNDGDDAVDGGDDDDTVYGWAGDDTLNGGKGNDAVKGGAGKDRVDGGDGADQLWGDRDAGDADDVAGNNFVQHQVSVAVANVEAGDTFTINVAGAGGFNALVSYTALAGENATDVEAKLEDLLDNTLGQSTGVGVAGTEISGGDIVIRGPVTGSQFTVTTTTANLAPVPEVRTLTMLNDQPDMGDVVNLNVNGTIFSITAPGSQINGDTDNTGAEIAALLQAAFNAAPVAGVTLTVVGAVMTFTNASGPFSALAHTVNPDEAAANTEFADITFNGFDAGEQASVQFDGTTHSANSLAGLGALLVADNGGNTDGFVIVDGTDNDSILDTIRFFDRDGNLDGLGALAFFNPTVSGGNGGSASISDFDDNTTANDTDVASVIVTPGVVAGVNNQSLTASTDATGAAATVDDNTARGADTFGIGNGAAAGTNLTPLTVIELDASLDVVNDFNAGGAGEGDKLDFAGLGAGTAANYAEFGPGVALNALDALGTANSALGGTTRFAAVEVGADLYVFADTDGDGSADAGVILVGTSVATFAQTDIV